MTATPMLSLLEVVKRTADFFEKNGVESPRLNAELILAHAIGIGRMQIYLQFERLLNEGELEKIRPLVRRRARREPLAYVLGTAAFRDLTLQVDKRVLVPRPETEQLVEVVQDSVTTPPASILDLGTGSGALALALARMFPESRVTAIDISEDALAVARANAERLGLQERVSVFRSEWFAAGSLADLRFDLIVSNPPYLTEAEWQSAEPEVREHEPKQALVADVEGCACLFEIIRSAPPKLNPGGMLVLETGVDQHARLLPAIESAGLIDTRSHQDWNGRDRFVSGRAPA